MPRQIFRDRKKHAMKNNFTDSWIHAIIVSEETFGEEKYKKKKKRRGDAEERERQRSWNFFVSSKEEDVTAGGNRIITS